jgi:bidirectional [NiFe] hydrogenase diaphorase subunit
MSEILLQIDGKEINATEGMTVLEAAQSVGIVIPTLCHHEKLEPYGGCRICTVEVRSEKVDRIRKMILELLLAHAPDAFALQDLAKEYGADKDRFEKEASFCIHCGLCVRYCAEVKKKNAVGFVDRGTRREISFIPEIASKECWDCKECFPLCPTEALQAAFVLTKALISPSSFSQPESEE